MFTPFPTCRVARTVLSTSALVGGLALTIGLAAPGLAAAEDAPPITLPPDFTVTPTTQPAITLTPDIVISLPPPTSSPPITVPVDITVPPPTSEPTITVPVDITLPPPTTTPAFDVITPPSAPQSPSATAGAQSITVTWLAPESTGGATITHYHLQRATDLDGEWDEVGFPASTSFTNNTGLTVGELYYYRVRAHNGAGYGPWSSVVSAKPYTFPSAPLYLEATPIKHGVKLVWDAPLSDGLSLLVGYHVSVFTAGCADKVDDIYILGSTTLDNTRTYSVDNGTAHCFKVQASNHAGYGPYSNHAIAVAGRPSAPESCSGWYQEGETDYYDFAYVSWEMPASWGGYEPLEFFHKYTVRFTNGTWVRELETSDLFITWDEDDAILDGLESGGWWVEISAKNVEGAGVACTVHPTIFLSD